MGGDGNACGAPLLLFLFFTGKYLKARAAELGNPSLGLLLVRGERGEAAGRQFHAIRSLLTCYQVSFDERRERQLETISKVRALVHLQ